MLALFDMILSFFEIICFLIYFDSFFEMRSSKPLFVLITYLMLWPTSVFWLRNYPVPKVAVNVVILAVSVCCFFWVKPFRALLFSAMAMGILGAFEAFPMLIMQKRADNFTFREEITGRWLIMAALMFLLLTLLIIKRIFGKRDLGAINDRDLMKFLLLPIFTYVIDILMMFEFADIKNPRQIYILLLIGMLLMGINFFVYYMLNDTAKREKLKVQTQNQLRLYQNMSDSYERQKKKTHEFQNHILVMEELAKNAEYDRLVEYMDKIAGSYAENVNIVSTNHLIADTIINVKYTEMSEKEIIFNLKVNDLSGLHIADDDLVVLLSNLLNNAIEACEKCDEPREISLKLVLENTSMILSVENTSSGKTKKDKGEYLTSKKDVAEHGAGIKNIISITEKYHGTYVIAETDRLFSFSIVIPN